HIRLTNQPRTNTNKKAPPTAREPPSQTATPRHNQLDKPQKPPTKKTTTPIQLLKNPRCYK
ncbi:hypothetical protein ACSMCS_22790, partial [Salmonella enterica]|uniref:hypothetical protein n=1 Tax=Salmonella enterica TaxID=28901 RepID=UPI003F1D0F5B